MYVPFVNSKSDANIAKQEFSTVKTFRLRPYDSTSIFSSMPKGADLWIDPGVDGLFQSDPDKDSPWFKSIVRTGINDLVDISNLVTPSQKEMNDAVASLLQDCVAHGASWITIPQLPHADSALTNSINSRLAKASNTYLTDIGWSGERILPLILSHSNQTTKKGTRTSKVKALARFAKESASTGLWIVDLKMSDQSGNAKNGDLYFPKLIELMKEAHAAVQPRGPVIAGPYWGLGVVMWARGLATHVAAGCGNGYQYRLPGGKMFAQSEPTRRLAIPPLRRWAKTSELELWLAKSAKTLSADSSAATSLKNLHRRFSKLLVGTASKRQVAREHLAWVSAISASPTAGRALALYQDLSTAYVRGKQLTNLKAEIGRARMPTLPALQLMTNCL